MFYIARCSVVSQLSIAYTKQNDDVIERQCSIKILELFWWTFFRPVFSVKFYIIIKKQTLGRFGEPAVVIDYFLIMLHVAFICYWVMSS